MVLKGQSHDLSNNPPWEGVKYPLHRKPIGPTAGLDDVQVRESAFQIGVTIRHSDLLTTISARTTPKYCLHFINKTGRWDSVVQSV